MFSISSTSKSKGCVSLPSEFALFSVKLKHLQEIVDSRVVLGGKHVSEDIHREQTGNGIRNAASVWFANQGW